MKIILTINDIPRELYIHDIKSVSKWFNAHKCNDKIEDSYIQLLNVLLLRCLNDLNSQTPTERNITVKTVGTKRITKVLPVYNSKVVMELFPPNIKDITQRHVDDLTKLQELVNVAVSSFEYGNIVSIKIIE